MNKNKFALDNIISFDKLEYNRSYQKYKELLKNLFYRKAEITFSYDFENNVSSQLHSYFILTCAESNCLDDLCCLLNINITDYSPTEYILPNDDIRYITYSDRLDDLPSLYFDGNDFEKLRGRIMEELINRKLIQLNSDKKTYLITSKDYFKIICQLCVFTKSYILRKTEAINKLKKLFTMKILRKINDVVKKKWT